jgi:integrase
MGSVTAYETNAGKRYRVIYRKPDHIQTQKRGFKTKRDAELFLAKVEIDKSRGAYVDPAKSRVLLGEWLDGWMTSRSDWRETSRERACGIVARHIKPELGGYPLASLNHQLIQNWAGSLSKTQGPASVRKIVNVLSGALQMAVRDGRLPANPAHGLNLPKVSKASKRYLTHAEVRDLADAVDALGRGIYRGESNSYGLLVLVLAYCGLRWGEASGLRVKDIDFSAGGSRSSTPSLRSTESKLTPNQRTTKPALSRCRQRSSPSLRRTSTAKTLARQSSRQREADGYADGCSVEAGWTRRQRPSARRASLRMSCATQRRVLRSAQVRMSKRSSECSAMHPQRSRSMSIQTSSIVT